MKIKIGKDPLNWRSELKTVEQIRAHAGDHITLMADVNCGYGHDVKTALQVGRALEAMDLFWYEEPLAARRYRRIRVSKGQSRYSHRDRGGGLQSLLLRPVLQARRNRHRPARCRAFGWDH